MMIGYQTWITKIVPCPTIVFVVGEGAMAKVYDGPPALKDKFEL
jgi:hypothetical protein